MHHVQHLCTFSAALCNTGNSWSAVSASYPSAECSSQLSLSHIGLPEACRVSSMMHSQHYSGWSHMLANGSVTFALPWSGEAAMESGVRGQEACWQWMAGNG